jgi:hypothetical protein
MLQRPQLPPNKVPTDRNRRSTNNKDSNAAHIMKTNLKVAAEYAEFQAPITTVPGSNHSSRKGFSLLSSQVLELMTEYRKTGHGQVFHTFSK